MRRGSRPRWRGSELADRLGVTKRTIRRDVTRLRELDYPVEAAPGLDGGHRQGAGRRLPPLLLENDEAGALVACLRMAAPSGTDSVGEAALRALTKLDQVLPPKLRALATALDDATQAIPRGRPAVDLAVLQQLSIAQRDHTVLRFCYRKPDASRTSREVEPAPLMTQGEHWYPQAFDRGREDSRVFRIDRMTEVTVTTWTFTPSETPPGDFQRDIARRYPCVVEVEMAVDVDAGAARVPAAHRDGLEPTSTGCRFRVGAPTWDDLAWHMLWASRELGQPLIIWTKAHKVLLCATPWRRLHRMREMSSTRADR